MKWKSESESLTVFLSGEIDHYAAEKLRERIEALIERNHPQMLILDFDEVSFMDSSGIGMLIGRYKTKASFGGKLYASGLHHTIERLYRMAGLHRIIPILEEERRAEA